MFLRLLRPVFPWPRFAPILGNANQEIEFELASGVDLGSLDIYSLAGQRVWSRAFSGLGPGSHRVDWNGRTTSGARTPASIYFVKLTSSAGTAVRRIVRVE